VRLDARDRAVDVPHDAPEVDLRLDRRETDLRRAPHPVREVGGGDEALARDAARPQAVSPGTVALDERDARADGRSDLRGDEPARPSADDDQVIVR